MTITLWLLAAIYLVIIAWLIFASCIKDVDLAESNTDKFSRMVKK